MRILLPLLFVCLVFSLPAANEHSGARALQLAATDFLSKLDSAQKAKVLDTFESADRMDWHYFPKDRPGLDWASMTPEQKALSWDLFRQALSQSGYEKAKGVVAAEKILWERSNHSDYRDPEKYYVTLFGQPGSLEGWAARLEGHHLSINVTILDGIDVYVTPSFFGANPDRDDAGYRPLDAEYQLAFKLVNSLNPAQLKKAAHEGKVPREIRTKAKQKVRPLEEDGLPASEMNDAQRALLMQLIQEYVGRYRDAFAADDLAKIEEAGFGSIRFLWAGSLEAGQPVYYRVQGPTFLLEYANTQDDANHSHTVWRDFENDFAYDALEQHLKEHH